MELEDILAEQEKVQEYLFRGRTRNFLIGEHSSRFKGAGFEIQSVDEWQRGDPVEDVNLPLSLETWPNKIFVTRKMKTKISPAVLVLDISPSVLLEIDRVQNKFRLEICLALAAGSVAVFCHDPVGTLCFSNECVEFFIAPKFGRGQLLYALENVLKKAREKSKELSERKYRKKLSQSNLNNALEVLASMLKSQCSVVIFSDFTDVINENSRINSAAIETLVAKHNRNLIFVILDDPLEFLWKGGRGLVQVTDIETGRVEHVRVARALAIRNEFVQKREEFRKELSGMGVESVVISYGDHYKQLAQFLAERRTTSR